MLKKLKLEDSYLNSVLSKKCTNYKVNIRCEGYESISIKGLNYVYEGYDITVVVSKGYIRASLYTHTSEFKHEKNYKNGNESIESYIGEVINELLYKISPEY